MYVNVLSVFRFRLLKVTSSSCYICKSHYRSFKGNKLLRSQFYRQPDKHKKQGVFKLETEEEVLQDESKLDLLLDRSLLPATSGHQVFVVQPYIKWGAKKKRNTTPELQLFESVTLVKTLRHFVVVDKRIVSLQFVRGKTVFGKGVLENLTETVKSNPKISAVFISINTLNIEQRMHLEEAFEVPVFDRYSIIINIFKEHAQTKEAKLQVKLAQLPYLWNVLEGISDVSGRFRNYETYFDPNSTVASRREVFRKKAGKIKKEIAELRQQRTQLRENREKHEIPVVAVVGYTNAGKTSLIKALTGKESLEPQDYLFATLDVTAHIGVLPSGLNAYFIDTLGFISDIPTYFIESFVATLEDAVFANVIIHVRDVSHPDTVAQNDKVVEILNTLQIPEATRHNVITVGNKIDLVKARELENYKDLILVSSTTMMGINILREEVEKKILQLSDLNVITIKVRTGSPEYFWLYEFVTVVKETPDVKDNQFTLLETIISSVHLAKFKHYFIKNYKA